MKSLVCSATLHGLLQTTTKGHVVTHRTPNDTSEKKIRTTSTRTTFSIVSIRRNKITEDYSRFVSLRPTVLEQQQTAEGHGIRIQH